MSQDIQHALRVETEFLAGVESNMNDAPQGLLPASNFKPSHHDEHDRLRRIMIQRKLYDHDSLSRLPRNRRILWHGSDCRWSFLPARFAQIDFLRKPTVVAVASVLAPLDHYVTAPGATPGDPPPIGATELMAHVRELVGDSKVPHVIGIASPTGFSDSARNASLALPNVSIVLVEPRPQGGWDTHAIGDDVPPEIQGLFDPEPMSEKIERVHTQIERDGADLLTGGISADSLAEKLAMTPQVIAQAFQQAAIKDSELRISSRSGTMVLFRGGPAAMKEQPKKSVLDRVRQLFSSEGDEATKIEKFSEQRAHLAQRRDRLYNDIGKLERRESDLLAQGKTNTSQVVRRRVAAQLAQVRRDIARQNTTAGMLNQQINIISTRVHNLTLIQQGQLADIPSAEDLATEAVQAEELLEQLKADADLVGGLETGLAETLTSREELDILKEFEDPQPATKPKAKTKTETEIETETKTTAPPLAEEPSDPEPESAQEPETQPRRAEPN